MFIQQAFKAKHAWWRYVIGLIVILLALFAGQVPFTVALFFEKGMETLSLTQVEMLQVLNSNFSFFLLLLSYAVGLGGVFLVVKILHQQSIRAVTTSRRKIDWGRFFFGFGLVGIYIIVFTLWDYAAYPEDYVWNFKLVPFLILLVIALVMVPLQTAFEEYLFRGYLMQGLGVLSRNRWFPLLITSVVFGGMHFWNPEVGKIGNIIMIHYIGTGFLLGIMTLMDEGIELSLGFHAGNNLIAALLVTADWTVFQTNSILKDISDPQGDIFMVLPIFVIYPLFLYIMAKKYNWTNWKEKLFGKVHPPETIVQERI